MATFSRTLAFAAGAGLSALASILVLSRESSQVVHSASYSAPPPAQPASPATNSVAGNFALSPIKYGLPVGAETLRDHNGFILSYNNKIRSSNWVCEHITKASVNTKVGSREDVPFKEDPSIHELFRSTLDDYRRSGFDRGHLAPAANHKYTQQAIEETFFLSNMSPQVGKGFNRDSWARLEGYVRTLTDKYTNVYVCTGPLFLPQKEADGKMYIKYQVIGPNHVAVPTHYFKVVAGEKADQSVEIQAFIMPNAVIADDKPLTDFLVPLQDVEKASGFLFFERIQSKYSKVLRK